MYVLRLYFFVFLLFALFQSIIASRLGTVESHAPAVPTTVTRYRLIGTYSPTSSEPSPCGFGHIAPTPAPTTLLVLMPTTSDSSMLASFWAMFMPYCGKPLALFLLAAFVVVASRSFAIGGRYCNSRTVCAQHSSINTIESAELAAPTSVEVTTPVSVEHIETAAPAAVEVTTPVSVEVTTPESVEVAAPVSVEVTTPVSVEVATSASVEVTTPVSVEVATSASVEVTTPVSVEVATSASVEVTTPVSVEVAAPAPAKVAEHAEQVVGANTAESATTTPFAIVSMAIYRTTARTPSGHTPSPYTAWTAGRNTQRKTSSDAPCVAPATARPATRTTPEKLALLRDTKSPSEIIECTLRTPSGQVPPPHAVWTAWRNTQRKISSASPCVAPATHVTSDMAEKLALLSSKFVESTPRTPSGRIPGRTVVTPGRTEAEKAAAMQAEAARAVAVRVRARQAAANSQTRRTKAHHS
ncbi:hypothetical protein GGI19_005004 [Coemansia pectinata]|uniref:Uncharacterized protein n=1 Tax=Coemansia pectinata TaxID=1052879 RepID=A0A9W8GWS5_9FUNG|nr:hypothetical protein GGI19_005004 [Coemansia pectinata]